MDDKEIIELFVKRDEQAITEAKKAYGSFCTRIAMNILRNHEDSEECLNDTLLLAWNNIPPLMPLSLKAYLGKVIRNSAISKYRSLHAKKRHPGEMVLLSELQDCIPDNTRVDEVIDCKQLTAYIEEWLRMQKKDEKILFVRRYWYGESIQELSKISRLSLRKVTKVLFRLRKQLRAYLQNVGFII